MTGELRKVKNENREFGSWDHYFIGELTIKDRDILEIKVRVSFTRHELDQAIERAANSPMGAVKHQ